MAHPTHLCGSGPLDWTVLRFSRGFWKASVKMTQLQASDAASELRLRGIPARAENAIAVCDIGLPEGPPMQGSPAYLGD